MENRIFLFLFALLLLVPQSSFAFKAGDLIKATMKFKMKDQTLKKDIILAEAGDTGAIVSGPLVSQGDRWWAVKLDKNKSLTGYIKEVAIALNASVITVDLVASPVSITKGASSTLTWKSTNATSCSAAGSSHFSGAKPASGSVSVNPQANTTYAITCSNISGSKSASVSIVVTSPVITPSPVVQFSASPNSIVQGSSSTLSWNATNATSCVASGSTQFTGSKNISGSLVVSPASNTVYSLNCSGAGGSLTSSVSVTVTAPPITPPPPVNPPVSGKSLAFPTAEGFGKYAKGGRGGVVFEVTNLNDSGPGSLRDCVEASGPRTCVFRVSGEIAVNDSIRARNPYLTIAGQTAPGDGIMLTIRNTPSVNYPFAIMTHDVIVRHIRIRPGPSMTKSDNVDAVLIGGPTTHDVILDHVTMSWGTDETFNIIGNAGTTNHSGAANTYNITVQWSMIYESLRNSTHTSGNHSRSTYIGYGPQEISFHHNIIANSTRRNPNLGTVGQMDFVNNVIYNSAQYNGEIYNRHGTNNLNFVGNSIIPGPSSSKTNTFYGLDLFLNQNLGTHKLYVKNNIDLNRPTNSGDERLIVDPKDWKYIQSSPVGYGTLSISPSEVSLPEQAYLDVLDFAGTTKPGRDSADTRFVNEVRNCQGKVIDSPSEVGGFPDLKSLAAPVDSDKDGIPDSWEISRSLNPNLVSDGNSDNDKNGYTNLEEYLNELAGDNLGSKVGKGKGTFPGGRCGFNIANSVVPSIVHFDVQPRAVRSGESVTVSYEAINSGSCKRSWNSTGSPAQFSAVDTVVVSDTMEFDLTCTKNGRDDWVNIQVFVTPDGTMPKPEITFSALKANLVAGENATLNWRAKYAGECRASKGWVGIKSVNGQETFPAEFNGAYTLTCEGPGGTSSASINLNVSGGKPVP